MRVRGEGSFDAPLMLVGEAPGREEDYSGRPFVGKSGQELTRYLSRTGIDRAADCWVTNLVRERPPVANGKQLPPSADDIRRDEGELYEELIQIQPAWIGAVGRVSARWFLGDIDMESAHGLAYPLPDPEGFVSRCVTHALRQSGSVQFAGQGHSGKYALEPLEWARNVRVDRKSVV